MERDRAVKGKTEASNKIRAAIYARVSSHKQAEQGDLGGQVEVQKKHSYSWRRNPRLAALVGSPP